MNSTKNEIKLIEMTSCQNRKDALDSFICSIGTIALFFFLFIMGFIFLTSCSSNYEDFPEPDEKYEGYIVSQKRHCPEGTTAVIYLPSGETDSRPWPEHWTIDIRHTVTNHHVMGIWIDEEEYHSLRLGDPYDNPYD